MKIQSMFQKDIDRPINGVVKVMQDDQQSLKLSLIHIFHDFKFCSCGACAVDGGHDYLRRCGNLEDWEELSEAEKVEKNGVLT